MPHTKPALGILHCRCHRTSSVDCDAVVHSIYNRVTDQQIGRLLGKRAVQQGTYHRHDPSIEVAELLLIVVSILVYQ